MPEWHSVTIKETKSLRLELPGEKGCTLIRKLLKKSPVLEEEKNYRKTLGYRKKPEPPSAKMKNFALKSPSPAVAPGWHPV